MTLLAVALLIGNEAIDRLLHPVPVEGAAMLAVAGLGIVVNVAATLVLARANRSSLNIEGAFQHILTDAFAFAATLIAGLVIVVTGFERADPIASLIVVVLMLRAAWKLLRASGRVLLEGAPDHVDLAEVRAHCSPCRACSTSTTCTHGSSPRTCRRCRRMSSSKTTRSATATPQ